MKSSSALLALPLCVLAIVAVACSGVTISVPTGPMFSVPSNISLQITHTGKVKSIDTDKNTLVLDVLGKDQTFTLTADTKFTNAGKTVLGGPRREPLPARATSM